MLLFCCIAPVVHALLHATTVQPLILQSTSARLAQSAERKALNLVVVGSSPTVGVSHDRPQNGRLIASH